MHFRLVSKSTTLDDLERPLSTLFQNKCVFGAYHENLNEDRPTVCGKKVSPKVVYHFLNNHLEFLREILHTYYLFTATPTDSLERYHDSSSYNYGK